LATALLVELAELELLELLELLDAEDESVGLRTAAAPDDGESDDHECTALTAKQTSSLTDSARI